MKKASFLFAILILIMSFASCADKSKDLNSKSKNLNSNIENGKCDIDISELNSTMAYSMLNEIVSNPEKNLGKIVKINGTFNIYQGEKNIYFSCLISDAAACCSAGLEFELEGEHKYPDDYPTQNSNITVIGVFDRYYEDNIQYCRLLNAKLI